MIHADGETERIRKAIAGGDLTDFWEIWEQNRNRFLKICMLQFRDKSKAEDALSGIMLKAVEVLPKYASKIQNFQSWLTRLAFNYCHDIHREESRYRFGQDLTETVTTEDDDATDPEIRFLEKQTKENVDRLLAGLSPSLRNAFMMRFYGGLSYREISKQAGVREVSIRKRIQRARTILQESLGSPTLKRVIASRSTRAPQSCDFQINMDLKPKSPVELLGPEPLLIRFAQVRMDSGAVVDMPIALDHKPTRIAMRIQTLRRHVSRYPSGWKKRLELAELLYVSGAWDRAIEAYKKVLKRNPRLVPVRFHLGLVLLKMNRLEEAEKTFQMLQDSLDPSAEPGWAHFLEGHIHLCRRHFKHAQSLFLRAISADPERGPYHRALGRVQEELERYRDALRLYDEAIKNNPHDILALTHAMKTCERLGFFEEARDRAKIILKLDHENIMALKVLADDRCRHGLVQGKEGARTRGLIRTMLKTGKAIADVHDSLAHYHVARGSRQEGLERLRHYVHDNPKNPMGWRRFACHLFEAGQKDRSVGAISQAVNLAKDDPEIIQSACRILNKTRNIKMLRPVVKNLLRLHQHRWSSWVILAQILATALRRRERVLDASRQAVKMHPDLPETWLHHALLLYRVGDQESMSAAILKGWTLLAERTPSVALEATLKMISLSLADESKEEQALWRDRAERLIARFARQTPHPWAEQWKAAWAASCTLAKPRFEITQTRPS